MVNTLTLGIIKAPVHILRVGLSDAMLVRYPSTSLGICGATFAPYRISQKSVESILAIINAIAVIMPPVERTICADIKKHMKARVGMQDWVLAWISYLYQSFFVRISKVTTRIL